MVTMAIQLNNVDDRLRSVSALTLFLFVLQLLKTTSGYFFPNNADTITGMIDFYLPITILFLVGLLYHSHYHKKPLPPMPKAYISIKNYVFWFIVFWILTALFLLTGGFGFMYHLFGFQTVNILGLQSFVLNFIVATMENLPLVMIAPVLFSFNLSGTGIMARIVEYIPAGILAAMSHMSVYWVQVQMKITRLQAQGVDVNPLSMYLIALFIAYIAFTIFYIVYRKWGFAASVALHQTFNMNNAWINGA